MEKNIKSKRNFKPYFRALLKFLILTLLICFFLSLLYLIFEELFIILQLSQISAIEERHSQINHYTDKMIENESIASGKLYQLKEVSKIALFSLSLSTNLNIHILILLLYASALILIWFQIEKTYVNFKLILKEIIKEPRNKIET